MLMLTVITIIICVHIITLYTNKFCVFYSYVLAQYGINAPNIHLVKIQNKIFRINTKTPQFDRNNSIHNDLDIPLINEFIKNIAYNFHKLFKNHLVRCTTS